MADAQQAGFAKGRADELQAHGHVAVRSQAHGQGQAGQARQIQRQGIGQSKSRKDFEKEGKEV